MNLKNRTQLLSVQTFEKRKEVPYLKKSRDNNGESIESPYMEMSRDNDQTNAYISNQMQLQSHSLTFIHKNKSLILATSILCRSHKAYINTASLDKLTCTNSVDFGKGQDSFGRAFGSKSDFNYLDGKLKVFKKDNNLEFRLVQIFKLGETEFNQLMLLRNQLVNAAEILTREENLTSVLIPTKSRDMDEQLKLAHKVVDVVD